MQKMKMESSVPVFSRMIEIVDVNHHDAILHEIDTVAISRVQAGFIFI